MSISSENPIEYNTWRSIKTRCYNPKSDNYKWYGGKGIIMSDAWLNNFSQFFADIGKRPSDEHSIDRIDSNGNYEVGNVRWATKVEQIINRGDFNRRFTYNGVEKCLSEWLEEFPMPRTEFLRRVNKGWDMERVLKTPYKQRLFKQKVFDKSTCIEYKSINIASKAIGIAQPTLHSILKGRQVNTTNLVLSSPELLELQKGVLIKDLGVERLLHLGFVVKENDMPELVKYEHRNWVVVNPWGEVFVKEIKIDCNNLWELNLILESI